MEGVSVTSHCDEVKTRALRYSLDVLKCIGL